MSSEGTTKRKLFFIKTTPNLCTPQNMNIFLLCSEDLDPQLKICSLVKVPRDALSIANLALGLVIANALNELYSIDVGLRWPNKIQLGPHVVGQYYIKVKNVEEKSCVVEVSIELRTNHKEASISRELGHNVSNKDIAIRIMDRLDRVLSDIEEGIRWRFVYDYMSRMANLGEEVRIRLRSGEEIVGEVLGLRRDGALAVYSPKGIKYVNAEDVEDITTLWP